MQRLRPHETPKVALEQYPITPATAAEILYIAAYTYDDVIDRTVADLGCGSGLLSIGAALMGAEWVVGVDVDRCAVRTAARNAMTMQVYDRTSWVTADIDAVRGIFDTVIQNPPFGVKRRGADRFFLQKALQIGNIVYSLHKAGESNRRFLKRFVEESGGEIEGIFNMKTVIPHTFKFHTEKQHVVDVDLYRIVGLRKCL